ncbi:unnamed protein product [Rodentolepis nana]|uniref:DUF4371 domain-containing protein n=1 Tax=Rodentolepis nana TaxID=102285 RepID=A0A0R3TU00_RODNA|nr:unnamed protein product [Rodentolepis nana]
MQKFFNHLEELRIRHVRSLDEVFHKFNAYETTFMNSSIGVQLGEVARQQIRALNNERLAKGKTNTYLRNLRELQHFYHAKHREDIELCASWLIVMLNANIVGQTNIGKALLPNLITSNLLIGTMCRRGDQTVFHFDNLLSGTFAPNGGTKDYNSGKE